MKYAVIAVNRHVYNTFHYEIPPHLVERIAIGQMVEVEFGTSILHGIVVDFDEESPVEITKPIRALADPTPVITSLQLRVAKWMAENLLAPIGGCLWLMLPPGLTSESSYRYTLIKPDAEVRSEIQKRIINLLAKRGPLTANQIARMFPSDINWKSSIVGLIKRGIVEREQIFNAPTARPKVLNSATLMIPPEKIETVALYLGRDSRRANVVETLLATSEHAMQHQLLMKTSGCNQSVLQTLTALGVISVENHQVKLAITPEEAWKYIIQVRGIQPYLNILYYLAENGGQAFVKDILAATKCSRSHILRLVDEGYIRVEGDEFIRDPLTQFEVISDTPPPLTADQQAAWDAIRQYIDYAQQNKTLEKQSTDAHIFVLYGVTGSGKTEIYLRAVEHVLLQGRQAIVLVPEIALTAQVVQRFMARFPKRVGLIHSGLSIGERYDTWRRAREGQLDVIVGPRSALFTPLSDIGLVILDEEHDTSYKNSPISYTPPYHARDVAIEMMRLNRGTVILGSATPSIETMYRVEQRDYQMVRLSQRVLAQRKRIERQIEYLHLSQARYAPTETTEAVAIDLPPIQVVDMRDELHAGNRSIFSRALQSALQEVLETRQQAILFLNRRGTATFVMCRDCGYVAKCGRCDTPLTYHTDNEQILFCHHCGYQAPLIFECPNCQSKRIRHFGAGTQLVHKTLHNLFPDARIVRWDQDTAKTRDAYQQILQRFLDRKADILIGTQMIAKGLDIPLVTLVGIISADTSLGFPDFRVGEHTFQMLTQVAGRAGRGLLGGRVILQTYQPENYAIIAAAQHDYDGFYKQEIAYRRQLHQPPFTRFVRILFQHRHQNKVMQLAHQLANILRRKIEHSSFFTASEVIGPAPCFYARIDDQFRWHVLVRTQNPVALLTGIDIPPEGMLDIDPIDLL